MNAGLLILGTLTTNLGTAARWRWLLRMNNGEQEIGNQILRLDILQHHTKDVQVKEVPKAVYLLLESGRPGHARKCKAETPQHLHPADYDLGPRYQGVYG